jgi:hypothetical protein
MSFWLKYKQAKARWRRLRDGDALEGEPVNDNVWELVLADMRQRDAFGFSKYKRHLAPHDGRDTLRDAYEEALDLCVYLRKALYERDGR